MQATITNVTYLKEYETKFGKLHSFRVEYDGKEAFYSSKSKDQTKFVKGKEALFTEETLIGKNNKPYLKIKPPQTGGGSNYARAVSREQSKYSGFAMSYAKDLLIAGKIEFDQLLPACKKMFDYMVKLDKEVKL